MLGGAWRRVWSYKVDRLEKYKDGFSQNHSNERFCSAIIDKRDKERAKSTGAFFGQNIMTTKYYDKTDVVRCAINVQTVASVG